MFLFSILVHGCSCDALADLLTSTRAHAALVDVLVLPLVFSAPRPAGHDNLSSCASHWRSRPGCQATARRRSSGPNTGAEEAFASRPPPPRHVAVVLVWASAVLVEVEPELLFFSFGHARSWRDSGAVVTQDELISWFARPCAVLSTTLVTGRRLPLLDLPGFWTTRHFDEARKRFSGAWRQDHSYAREPSTGLGLDPLGAFWAPAIGLGVVYPSMLARHASRVAEGLGSWKVAPANALRPRETGSPPRSGTLSGRPIRSVPLVRLSWQRRVRIGDRRPTPRQVSTPIAT